MALFIFISLSILLVLSAMFQSASILVIGLIGLLLVLYIGRNGNQRLFSAISLIFVISVILIISTYYGYIHQYSIPYFGGGSDDLFFENYSEHVVDKNYMFPEQYISDPLLKSHNSKGFLWILSWLIRISNIFGDYHTIAYRILNIYFLISLSILVFRYFEKTYKFTSKQNLLVLYTVSLFPNSLYISIHVFRDTLIILLLFSVFFLWDNYINADKKRKFKLIKAIVLTLILSYISYWIRSQSLIFITAIIVISTLLKNKNLSFKNFGVFFILSVLAIILASFYDIWDLTLAFSERYTNHKLEISDGLSNKIFLIPLFPFGMAIRLAYGLISPIPVTILSISKIFDSVKMFFDVIIGFGVIVQIYMLPYLFKNIKKIDKVMITFVVFLMGIVIATFTFRHFIMLYPFMAILIFRQFFETRKNEKFVHLICTTGVLVFFASLYLLIK
jgi:hypothetical protein